MGENTTTFLKVPFHFQGKCLTGMGWYIAQRVCVPYTSLHSDQKLLQLQSALILFVFLSALPSCLVSWSRDPRGSTKVCHRNCEQDVPLMANDLISCLLHKGPLEDSSRKGCLFTPFTRKRDSKLTHCHTLARQQSIAHHHLQPSWPYHLPQPAISNSNPLTAKIFRVGVFCKKHLSADGHCFWVCWIWATHKSQVRGRAYALKRQKLSPLNSWHNMLFHVIKCAVKICTWLLPKNIPEYLLIN